ncbi:hypothetical protein AAFF_G00226720 [Aldrovandia affinis]|uniref:Uncharacterized protein n=1 Tax=Aldrovandia affinis TaxID=143900 RepID=A0AAD7TBD3_9TELE|nr:hypothetical protein AAFF_G00226720 [Aldrovandia affinis]
MVLGTQGRSRLVGCVRCGVRLWGRRSASECSVGRPVPQWGQTALALLCEQTVRVGVGESDAAREELVAVVSGVGCWPSEAAQLNYRAPSATPQDLRATHSALHADAYHHKEANA